MGLRVPIFLQQPSLSGSGVLYSQSPCSGPGPMCCAALDHSGPEAGGQWVPVWDPASRSRLPNMWGLRTWYDQHRPGPKSAAVCAGSKGQRPRVSKHIWKQKSQVQVPQAKSQCQAPKQESKLLLASCLHGSSPCTITSKLQLKYRKIITQNHQKSSWMEAWQLWN